MEVLLNKCVPQDNPRIETQEHKNVKDRIRQYNNYNLENDIDWSEIERAIKKLRNKTAPGIDKQNTEIIKEFWKLSPNTISIIMNNCFRNCTFPDIWKTAKLKIIIKDINKDKKLLNSYRPISLLTTLGKVLERIIVERIQNNYTSLKLDNNNQY